MQQQSEGQAAAVPSQKQQEVNSTLWAVQDRIDEMRDDGHLTDEDIAKLRQYLGQCSVETLCLLYYEDLEDPTAVDCFVRRLCNTCGIKHP